MKKTLIVLTILFSSLSAKAQFFPFQEVNFGHMAVGIQGGAVGIGKEFTKAAFGANVLGYGVYVDFLINTPEHRYTRERNKWHDDMALSFHAGYQIPITEMFRIIPLVGYSEINTGTTDGYDRSTTYDEKQHRWIVRNHYTKEWKHGGFDAGAALVVNLGRININVNGTLWGVYGGIGFEF